MRYPVIAVGFPITEGDRHDMAAELGSCHVVDIRLAPADSTVVLVHPCSPQALRSLRRSYPGAEIVVVDEAAHPDQGAVHRALDAGADEYAATADLHEVAHRLRPRALTQRGDGGPGPQPATDVA